MTHTEYQAKLDEILYQNIQFTQLGDFPEAVPKDRNWVNVMGKVYAFDFTEVKLALTKLTEEVVEEVIGKDHLDFTVEDLYADNWIFLNEQKAEQRTTKTKLLRGEL